MLSFFFFKSTLCSLSYPLRKNVLTCKLFKYQVETLTR